MWGGSGNCTLTDTSGCSWEWWYGLMPYCKNVGMLYCPERSDGSVGSYNAYGQLLGIQRYSGYGYNWGLGCTLPLRHTPYEKAPAATSSSNSLGGR